MGADFCLYGLPACTITNERRVWLENLIEDTSWGDPYVEGDIDEYRGRLRAAVEWYAWWAKDSRETAYIRLEGMPYGFYVTGGLSWGDHPTEAAVECDRLTPHIEIWKHLRAWAIEDAQEEEKPYDITATHPLTRFLP